MCRFRGIEHVTDAKELSTIDAQRRCRTQLMDRHRERIREVLELEALTRAAWRRTTCDELPRIRHRADGGSHDGTQPNMNPAA